MNVFQTYLIYKSFLIFINPKDIINSKFLYLCCLIYYFVTSFLHIFHKDPIVMMISNLLLLYLISVNFARPIWQKLLSVSLIYILLMIIESVCVLVVNYFLFEDIDAVYDRMIFSLFVSKLFTFILIYILDIYIKAKDSLHIDFLYKVSLLLFPVGSILIFHALLSKTHKHLWIILVLCILLFNNIFITVMYEMLGRKHQKDLENQLLIQQNNYYLNQIKLIDFNNEKIKFLHHDFKNHIISIKRYIEMQEWNKLGTYFNEVFKDAQIDANKEIIDTGNTLLDSILNYKLLQANNNKIIVETNINVPSTLPFNAIDINIILGNLLDNAIEANMKLSPNERYLHLNIQYDRDMLFIIIVNSYKLIKSQNKKLITTKPDAVNHGFGLKSIQKIVNDYNGCFEQSWDSMQFKSQIILYRK